MDLLKRVKRILHAIVERPAHAERYRVRAIAEAEQFRLQAEATGRAEASKFEGLARAEVEKAQGFAAAEVRLRQGLAEADVIQAQGAAEAEAMNKKVQTGQEYNEAAIVEILLRKLPEIVQAVAAPLAKTEKIIMISNGGDALGAAKITKDLTDIIAQVPPLVEAVSGVDMKKLAANLPELLKKQKPSGSE
jgi:flotillin